MCVPSFSAAKRLSRWNGLLCIVAKALNKSSTEEITDQTEYYYQQHLASKNGN